MGSDRYCLRWNNHQNNLLGVFSQLLQEESLVDVTLACSEGHSIRAHKVVLSACSSYFQSLFLDHPNRHPIIILKDVCFAELRTLVEFMYRGEVNLDYCQLPTFLRTAKSLQVKGLTEMTHLRTNVSPDNDIFRSPDGQSQKEKLPSTVIATAANVVVSAAHEPLPLIRRSPRSPNDAETSEQISADTVPHTGHHHSPPTTSTSAVASSPARSTGTVGFETSQPNSPPSRLPASVSPHPADTSSICDDQRSMTPDLDDDVSSIHSGPSDMTIGSQISLPQCLKALPGPSNFPPEQQVPLVSASFLFSSAKLLSGLSLFYFFILLHKLIPTAIPSHSFTERLSK